MLFPTPGPVAIVSQSGAYGGHLAYLCRARNIGVGFGCPTRQRSEHRRVRTASSGSRTAHADIARAAQIREMTAIRAALAHDGDGPGGGKSIIERAAERAGETAFRMQQTKTIWTKEADATRACNLRPSSSCKARPFIAGFSETRCIDNRRTDAANHAFR